MRLFKQLVLVAGILFVELATAAESGYDSPDRENRNRTVLLVARLPYGQFELPPFSPGRILVLVIDHPNEDQSGGGESDDTQSSRIPSFFSSSRDRGGTSSTSDATQRLQSPNSRTSGSGSNSFSNVNQSGYTSNYGGSRPKPRATPETPPSRFRPNKNTGSQDEPVPTIEAATSYTDSNGDQYSSFPSDSALNKRLNYPQVPASKVIPSDRPSHESTQTNYNPSIKPSISSNRRTSTESSYGSTQTRLNDPQVPASKASDRPSYESPQTPEPPPVGPKFAYQAATNEFGINLMKQLINKNENTLVSPLPLANSLAMLYFGSKGNTKAQLGRVLNYNKFGLDDRKVLASIKKTFEVTAKSKKIFIIEFLNYIFSQKGLNVTDDFKTIIRNDFVGNIEEVDFLKKPGETLKRINKLITEGTKGFIKDPIASVEPNSLIMLVNVIYFKGGWQEPFATEATFDSTFANDGVREVPVRMMHMQNHFRIKSLPEIDAEALQIPYKGGIGIIMLIILPNNKTGVDQMLEKMDIGKIVQDIPSYKNVSVDLYMPRFEVNSKYKLKQQLAELGVTDMFIAGRAQLPGMDNNNKAVASNVIHEVKMTIDEVGTEAAAVTTIPLFKRSASDVFAVKHPFVFMLMNTRSNTVFFMGKLLRMPDAESTTERLLAKRNDPRFAEHDGF